MESKDLHQQEEFLSSAASPRSDKEVYRIGKYGRLRQRYLEEHRRGLYCTLMVEGKLAKHLAEIDRACKEQLVLIESAMMEREGVTEALKATDQLEWVRRRNSIYHRAEEIVLTELVYA